ncbi:MAG: hypothetical protein H6887_02000 [Hoeflea sp.]|nr:hypothetical protein [Hoeflea sp.]
MQQADNGDNLADDGVPGAAAASRGNGLFLGIYLLISTLGLTLLLVLIWPSACPVDPKTLAAAASDAPAAAAATTKLCSIWTFSDSFGIEARLLTIVLISGALGSAIFSARAFATFHGLKRYDPDWNWWYVMRQPIGMGLALFLYLVIRGGLFTASVGNSDQVMQTANPFGFAALAALAGMFAKEASDKLEEVFQSVFSTSDKQPPAEKSPVIDKLEPVKKAVKDENLALVVLGKNFDRNAKVTVGTKERTAQFRNAGRIEVTLTADDLAAKAKLPVVVVNPDGKGGTSSAKDLAVG